MKENGNKKKPDYILRTLNNEDFQQKKFDFKVLNQKTGNFLPDHFQPLRNLNFNR